MSPELPVLCSRAGLLNFELDCFIHQTEVNHSSVAAGEWSVRAVGYNPHAANENVFAISGEGENCRI